MCRAVKRSCSQMSVSRRAVAWDIQVLCHKADRYHLKMEKRGVCFLASWFFLHWIVTGFVRPAAALMPIVGILTQPAPKEPAAEMILASYVKWLEAAGARPVPIYFSVPEKGKLGNETDAVPTPTTIDDLYYRNPMYSYGELSEYLDKLDGILLPGGNADLSLRSPFGRVSYFIFRHSVEKDIPIWGTCMGFEQMMIYSTWLQPDPRLYHSLTEVDAENLVEKLDVLGAEVEHVGPSLSPSFESGLTVPPSESAAFELLESRSSSESDVIEVSSIASRSDVEKKVVALWSALSDSTKKVLTTQPVVINMHSNGTLLSQFIKNSALHTFWLPFAYQMDRKGTPFIALAQGAKRRRIRNTSTAKVYAREMLESLDRDFLPVYAVQFHPEKNLFEYFEPYDDGDFDLTKPVHDSEALVAMLDLARAFVAQAAKFALTAEESMRTRMSKKEYTGKYAIWLFSPRCAYGESVRPHLNTGWLQHYLFRSALDEAAEKVVTQVFFA